MSVQGSFHDTVCCRTQRSRSGSILEFSTPSRPPFAMRPQNLLSLIPLALILGDITEVRRGVGVGHVVGCKRVIASSLHLMLRSRGRQSPPCGPPNGMWVLGGYLGA